MSRRRAHGAVHAGLLAPRLVPLLAGLALAFVMLLGLQWVFTSGLFTRVPREYLLRDQHDDYMAVTYAVAELKRNPPSGVPVYVLGGSSANEMVVSQESLQAALRAASGRDVSVHLLAACSQTFGQTLAIVDNLPPGPGVVVVGVAPNRFNYTQVRNYEQAGGKPFLMSSEALEEVLAVGALRRHNPLVLLPGMVDYAATYGRWVWQRLLDGNAPRVAYVPHRVVKVSFEERASERDRLVEPGIHGLWERAPVNAEALSRALGVATGRGYTVALLEGPINFAFLGEAWDPGLEIYQPLCKGLALEYGGRYINFTREIDLSDDDFADLTHLLEPGREKWEPRLAVELAPIVRSVTETGGGASGPQGPDD